MSKKQEVTSEIKKIFVFTSGPSAYGFDVVEIPEHILKTHGKVVENIEPDVFSVCENQLIKKARDVFGF